MTRKKEKIFLIITVLFLFILNYSFLDSLVVNYFDESNLAFVTRIVDGDTIIANNQSIRLLAINCPEKGEKYSKEAKEFLEKTILNKTIKLETYGTDLYHRTLAYAFYDGKNINLEIIKNGYANAYFPEGKQKYYEDFQSAWKVCAANSLNFCSASKDKCADCIRLREFDYKNEIITLHNICSQDCNLAGWTIKDEGRKKFIFPDFILKKQKDVQIIVSKKELENTDDKLFWIRNDYVWTNTGDTMFLRDSDGDLVIWKNY
jgi:micrococcal nuclease